MRGKAIKVDNIDDYLAAVPEEARGALEKLRRVIRSAARNATEVISYRMPMFKHKGRLLVGFAAFKNHCSFFPMSAKVLRAHVRELKGYRLSKGTIRFVPSKPIPVAVVKKLVRARITENEGAVKRPTGSANRCR